VSESNLVNLFLLVYSEFQYSNCVFNCFSYLIIKTSKGNRAFVTHTHTHIYIYIYIYIYIERERERVIINLEREDNPCHFSGLRGRVSYICTHNIFFPLLATILKTILLVLISKHRYSIHYRKNCSIKRKS